MKKTKILGIGAIIMIIVFFVGSASAVEYEYEKIELPGYTYQYHGYGARGINDNGIIVGDIHLGAGYHNGFILNINTNDYEETLENARDAGRDVNNNGDIAWVRIPNSGTQSSMLELATGQQISIVPPNSQSVSASGLSDDRTIVGYFYCLSDQLIHGYIYKDGSYTVMENPFDGTNQYVSGINNNGLIVGYMNFPSGNIPYSYKNGEYHYYDQPPGSSSTYFTDVNDNGQIVGYLPGSKSFVYDIAQNKYTTDIIFPGATWTQAYGINNSGEIVGRYADASGKRFGFIARPNSPPIADAGDNLTISSEQIPTTIIQGASSDEDPDDVLEYQWKGGETVLLDWTPVGESGEAYLDLSSAPYLAIGQHSLTLEVSDGKATATDDMILTIDNSAPHAAPTGTGVYEIFSPVTFGGDVSDFDGDLLIFEWLEAGNALANGQVQAVYGGDPVPLPDNTITGFSLGQHTITLKVNDGVNADVTGDITVDIIDTTAPTLAPVPNKTILWPPNHKLVDIIVEANANDNAGGSVTLSATVSSNEPENGLGDGDMAPDWSIPVIDQENGIIDLQLRSERSGSGDGRIYTVTTTATDESGNSSQATVEIIVPHDKSKK